MKRALMTLSVLMSTLILFAQSSDKIVIKGKAFDTLSAPLPFASVLLLDYKDSTLISYTHSKDDGSFEFKNVKRNKYFIKITFIGYIPVTIKAIPDDSEELKLGSIKLKGIAKELMEVVVREAKAPLTIRGDTIEYDATTFKVPPGSTVEDLLRKLPGIEVDFEGSIKSQGQNVTKVTVDGKRFFGSDPKAATKNLPSEAISKIQVFNEETEEKKLTGVSSTPPDKTMNLQLKDDFKKGGFGKVIGGYGTEERAEIKGSYNKFNEKEQFSVVGVGNNTGKNGLGWDDYQDFKGAGSATFDPGESFGFGDRNYYEGNVDELSFGNSFFGNPNGGFPENYIGGLNYNYDHKKTKFSSMYYYDQKGVFAEAERFQQNFLPDRTYFNTEFGTSDKLNSNHQAEIKLDQVIDSLNSITITSNLNSNTNNNTIQGNYIYKREDGSISNQSDYYSHLRNISLNFRTNVVYRMKFKNKGRSLGLGANYAFTNSNKNGDQQSDNIFFDSNGLLDSSSYISQDYDSKSDWYQFKANGIYVEPLTKRIFWQTFYNYSLRGESADRNVYDNVNDEEIQNDVLSRFYDNSVKLNRLGSLLRYSYNGLNISAGAAFQSYDISGNYKGGVSSGIEGTINRTFTNWIPNINFTWSLKGNRYLNANYSVYAREPSVNNLQPIIDNTNPLFIKVGNPNLIPEIQQSVRIGYNRFNSVTFISYYVNLSYATYQNQFIQEQTIDSFQVLTTRPINFSGANSANGSLSFGFPIIKNKFTINLGYYYSLHNSFSFVNSVKNKTNTGTHSPSIKINLTPGDNISVYINASYGISDTKYDINTSQNQLIYSQNYSASFNSKLIWGCYFNSSFSYQYIENNNFGENLSVPLLNFSIYKIFLKNNRGELRFSLYDVFNENINISKSASLFSVSEIKTENLKRYAMLSFTYNLRGVTPDLNKSKNYF